jgi:hypothetical protein
MLRRGCLRIGVVLLFVEVVLVCMERGRLCYSVEWQAEWQEDGLEVWYGDLHVDTTCIFPSKTEKICICSS